jgi:hypothetical protein
MVLGKEKNMLLDKEKNMVQLGLSYRWTREQKLLCYYKQVAFVAVVAHMA